MLGDLLRAQDSTHISPEEDGSPGCELMCMPRVTHAITGLFGRFYSSRPMEVINQRSWSGDESGNDVSLACEKRPALGPLAR